MMQPQYGTVTVGTSNKEVDECYGTEGKWHKTVGERCGTALGTVVEKHNPPTVIAPTCYLKLLDYPVTPWLTVSEFPFINLLALYLHTT